MRPPDFWSSRRVLSTLLVPAGCAYALATRLRLRRAGWRAPVPVICVGNVGVGGAGKTPVALALARLLAGRNPHFLTRGYRGREAGPLRVDPAKHDARAVGDEPLLLARAAPTWVARDRAAGARAAVAAGAGCIVMDDGHQNPALAKDLSLVVVDGGYGFGNGRVIPAGPLREPIAAGLARADAIVLLHPQGAEQVEQEWLQGFAKPILHARLEPSGIIPDGPLVAFAGLARPEKFFDTLTSMGAKLADAVPFPDHHPFSDDDLKHLEALAKEHGARLITTEKDAARLSLEWRARVAILPVAARFADDAALENLLAPIRSRMNAPHG